MSHELQNLGAAIHTLRANNPGLMTGAGTQSYLIGHRQLLLVDPGPDLPEQSGRLLAAVDALQAQVCGIVLTHLHRDHAAAAAQLQAQTHAPIYAMPAHPEDGLQVQGLDIRRLQDGDDIACDRGSLRVIHTPGHVDNHCCFWWPSSGDLLTGDHLITGSTVVIIPPYGHMGRYMQSLQRLLDLPLRRLLPGHGAAMSEALAIVAATLRHRRDREAKVRAALQQQAQELTALLPRVYDDVAVHLHPIAALSLQAHLIHLQEQGQACATASGWRLTASSR